MSEDTMYYTPAEVLAVIDPACGAGAFLPVTNPPYSMPETYEDREQRRWAENLAIITAVAGALGGEVASSGYYSGSITVDSISLRCWIEANRLHVAVQTPTYVDDRGREQRYSPRPGTEKRISLNKTRPVERLAADIRRRILPYATEMYPQWVAAAEAITQRSMTADRYRALLVSLRGRETGWREVVDDRRGSRYDPRFATWWAKEFHGDRCKLEINGVSPELAEQIIMLIDEFQP